MAKEGIHPPYHPVVFKDASTGATVITRSTMTSEQKIKMEDGNEYPLILLEITSDSHPFYTGTQRLIDTQGRPRSCRSRSCGCSGRARTSTSSTTPAPG